jgi:hypothetical protein
VERRNDRGLLGGDIRDGVSVGSRGNGNELGRLIKSTRDGGQIFLI